jgi:hypothetical protein
MAHFVKMSNNTCGEVIVIRNEVLENKPFPESEAIGIAFCKSLYGADTDWRQTSYNGNFRGTYAVTGMIYDPVKDEFTFPVIEE